MNRGELSMQSPEMESFRDIKDKQDERGMPAR